jgi:2-polyprenyl-6-methoxyphenol hydroxylase-like FAD-dependent oxidoreductase
LFILWVAAPQKFRVAVVGGGPSGACAAEALAKSSNIECTLFERKLDNAKPCGGTLRIFMRVYLLLKNMDVICELINLDD